MTDSTNMHASEQSGSGDLDDSIAVTAVNLSKLYQLGGDRRASLYDRLSGRHYERTSADAIWALKGVHFTMRSGQVVGVLGRNGSGKSTLMKILARVTVPTEGEASVVGRVAGLLQAGTGFHPELTGRDNIMLSGAILGMTSREIDAVFEDVVAFAEIGRFLNTPVKHYSSGMQMRLGFSVSAHLMADVMLIDEVLSVGDSAFQRKCRTRIKDLVSQGRTVLLASHSMGTVKELCSSVLVLDGGIQVFFGAAREGIALYEEDVSRR